MSASPTTLTGRLAAPDSPLPAWAVDRLHLALWDRDAGPDAPLAVAPASGPRGDFRLALNEDAALRLVLGGHREGPQQAVSLGWGEALDPVLAILPWPLGAEQNVVLDWTGQVSLIGYVEQFHLQEFGGLALIVLELVGRPVPLTYGRLPDLPLPPLGDRHGLHVDRHLEDTPEHVYYLLVEAETPLAALAQDALVSSLQVAAVASLGDEEGGWHEAVNLPLILDALTLISP